MIFNVTIQLHVFQLQFEFDKIDSPLSKNTLIEGFGKIIKRHQCVYTVSLLSPIKGCGSLLKRKRILLPKDDVSQVWLELCKWVKKRS